MAAFLSGVSALLFETLWFRQAGLAFGNGIWASSLVLSSFMAGLALGSGLGARLVPTVRRPARLYAGLEVSIAVSGVLLVWLLPHLTRFLAPVFYAFADAPWILQPARFATAFVLLVAPAVCMGATLPALVAAVGTEALDFGRVLGRLYGWNTLGAVVGAATSELVWLPAVGVQGSGFVAAVFNGSAAALALAVAGPVERRVGRPSPRGRVSLGADATRLLAASFLAGAAVLALEVVWFRFLSLFLATTALAFAMMLAVVLAGIGLGSLGAALWLRVKPNAHQAASRLALVGGALCVLCYVGFGPVISVAGARKSGLPGDVVELALPLMLPVALLSGALFTLLGKRLDLELNAAVRSTGLLVLANTLGSMLGPLLAGFVLLPRLGMERALFLLAISYGLVALLAARRPYGRDVLRTPTGWLALASFVAAVLMFPHGLMERSYLDIIARRLAKRGERVIALREGHLETILYAQKDFVGEPLWYRLVTDGYSMSATNLGSKRYMALFAYLPAALHPRLRTALLISFGVGTTARSLVNLGELEAIDVVDISPEILEMSELVFPRPDEHPLRDPRVRVHVEDGRYFLETSPERFDLITAEPPPPAYAGVVNLYTREYFQRMRERLNEGGLASYWLPVVQLRERDARAIVAAFCDAFPDCTLWQGTLRDWILLGGRGVRPQATEEGVRRLWEDPPVARELHEIGLERPEQLAGLFLADADELRRWTADTPPLVDDRPHRGPIPMSGWSTPPPEFAALLDARQGLERFRRSSWIQRTLPPSLRSGSEDAFQIQQIVTLHLWNERPLGLETLHHLLTETELQVLPLWLLGTDVARQRAVDAALARGREGPAIEYQLGLRALATRDYDRAADHFAKVPDESARRVRSWELYALLMAGRTGQAQELARRLRDDPQGFANEAYWSWMREQFDLP